ncbi:DMT family transporter [Cryptosporangium aurantiacum]|uniref:Magnesium transporter NIPA n=1 Tax=Cryptosporangium aurantiacum TaxID=134849 RepID=A0A1M7RIU3_9ACTN|nr:DMT family transporter [Cryptosporangium aurantiacum]SHN46207.1 hypothetical protein SAMN05443668_11440 [Cryptosporangium aurantiacum]
MGTVLIGIALALLSSVAYAAAAVVQERLAELPVRRLAMHPRWWTATALNGVAALLHLAALRAGPLSLIQALGVLTLPMAVPLAAMTWRRRVSATEWNGIAFTLAGLVGLVLLIGSAGTGVALTMPQLVVLLIVIAAVLVALEGVSRMPRASVLWTAAAAGVAFGISSALSQTITVRITDDGLSAVGTPLVVTAGLAVAVLTVAGLLLTQRSYRDGLGAPLAVSTIANPVAAAVVGIVLLGDRVTGGYPGAALAVACAAGAAIGVTLLAGAAQDGRAHPRTSVAATVNGRPPGTVGAQPPGAVGAQPTAADRRPPGATDGRPSGAADGRTSGGADGRTSGAADGGPPRATDRRTSGGADGGPPRGRPAESPGQPSVQDVPEVPSCSSGAPG